ncbi:MAG: GFA family protein [Gammaproteobacteria bacterium]|nr:GFA family protein [Gammaproteobacteria bacterium]
MSRKRFKAVQGSCHCQAVQFEIETDFPELTTCDCSICKRKNALMVKVHNSHFRILSGEEKLSVYQFHTQTASHYFCSICGIYPFHKKRVTPDYYGVNVNCLHEFEAVGIPVRATDGIGMD